VKALGTLVVVALTFGLVACGSSNSTTAETEAPQESGASSAKVEALELEKETAEAEARKAEAEARKESREAARQKAKAKAQNAAEQAESEPEPEAEPEPAEVPNVVGMRLPQAQAELRAAGYRTRAENTDTVFGIVVPSHYTVCEQSEPSGNVVTVLAQKYGC
jgi:beta-lactam-binding protein with PASTA domain